MIAIRNESELRNWFKKNYGKLGFSKIIKSSTKGFPDFIALEDKKRVKVELEIKSSNFLLHNHPSNELTRVVCVLNDAKLDVPTITIKEAKIVGWDKENSYSIKRMILGLFKKDRISTPTEIAKKLGISWNTAEKHLLELALEGKLLRIKKAGVNLWVLK